LQAAAGSAYLGVGGVGFAFGFFAQLMADAAGVDEQYGYIGVGFDSSVFSLVCFEDCAFQISA
jgi:hypothetical protein